MAGFFIKTFLSKNGVCKALEKLKEEERNLPETIKHEIEKALIKKFPKSDLKYLMKTYSDEINVVEKELFEKYNTRISQRIVRLNNLIEDFSV